GRVADGHLSRPTVQVPGRTSVHEQTAVRTEARAWHAAAPVRPRGSPRQDRRAARDGPGRAATQAPRPAELAHRQLAAHRVDGAGRMPAQGGRRVRVEGEVPETAAWK